MMKLLLVLTLVGILLFTKTHPQNISRIKCKEYHVRRTTFLHLINDPEKNVVTKTESRCKESVNLIVGGRNAKLGEFPYMVALSYSDGKFRCGGTLISENFVMTAAHCTGIKMNELVTGNPVKVRLGDLNLLKTDDLADPIDVDVEKIIVHPDYRRKKKYNDIALVKLKESVGFSKAIRPACLWTEKIIPDRKVFATGWGTTSYDGENSDDLKMVLLQIFDNLKCKQAYPKNKAIPNGIVESMLCAGDEEGGKDTCQGDSGGPLVLTKENGSCEFYLVGVTSFGIVCGVGQIPAIYTRVSEFLPWIEANVWP